jgi:hypothetical protein
MGVELKPSKRILVLYWYPVNLESMRLAIRQHLKVMDASGLGYSVTYHNVYANSSRPTNLSRYDVILLHTTFLCIRWNHLFYNLKWGLRWINECDCLKIAIPQDEYDHSEILDEWLFEMGVSIIFSCFDEKTRAILYPIMKDRAAFYPALTGYIHDETAGKLESRLPDLEDRPNHIVYRASQLPYWFGSHGQLKHELADIIAIPARACGFTVDISTSNADTIVGEAWLDFMASGKAVIGCESGSSALDRRGEIKSQIQILLRENPAIRFEEVSKLLPDGWDGYAFFAISPRHLEAVITKTCQVLVEGSYDGILEPYKHYIPLKRDLSNIDEVLEQLRNIELLQRIVEQAYQDIYKSGRYSYRSFARQIDAAISKQI